MQSNNDEKKYRFFDPFTGEAPLNLLLTSIFNIPKVIVGINDFSKTSRYDFLLHQYSRTS